MTIKFDSVCIWSENYKKLAEFYEKVMGFEITHKINLPDDTGLLFKIGEGLLFVGYHSEVKGEAKDPYRIMPGFHVDSVKKIYEDLSKKGVKFIKPASLSPDGEYYVATSLDPDGNIIQFFSSNP